MEKIVNNLMGNALKYTPKNGTIIFKGKRKADNFEIVVSNSGKQIPKEVQQKMFDRFYQGDTHNPGAGIGLALTKELVDLHKGSISLISEKDGLTKFLV